MPDKRKQKLIALGPKTLANALLIRSEFSRDVGELIEQLIATPQENQQRFRQAISSLQSSDRHIDNKESYGFSKELRMLLKDIKLNFQSLIDISCCL